MTVEKGRAEADRILETIILRDAKRCADLRYLCRNN